MLCLQQFCSCSGPAFHARDPCRSRRVACTYIRATPNNRNEFDDVGGNKDLQEALMQQLRVQVENETLKEEIKEDLKGKVENLKQIGEELIEQLDAELGIEKFRTELESTQILSEANDKFNELEQQVQQLKDQIKADQADLRAFESASASARSQGLFFRSLYQPSPEEEEDNGADSSSSTDAGSSSSSSSKARKAGKGGFVDPSVRQAAAAVTASAESEVGSPFRMYLFGYMALVLALVVMQDLSTSDPQYALDGLYGVLGLLLGINAYNEKKALGRAVDKQQPQAEVSDAVNSADSKLDEVIGVKSSSSDL